jgi:hypothetical protein
MNVPETIDPSVGMANLKERAAGMTVAPHVMSPDTEAAKQLDTTTVQAAAEKVAEPK